MMKMGNVIAIIVGTILILKLGITGIIVIAAVAFVFIAAIKSNTETVEYKEPTVHIHYQERPKEIMYKPREICNVKAKLLR